MKSYNFYVHKVSGDIAKLGDWRSDYENMDIESWHGRPAEDCDPNAWIEDGELEAIELYSNTDYYKKSVDFAKIRTVGVTEGEGYPVEIACPAEDSDGERYKIIWKFDVVKGWEPDSESLPWDDESFIDRVEAACLNKQYQPGGIPNWY